MWAELGCLPGGRWEVRSRCRAGSLQEPRTGRAPGVGGGALAHFDCGTWNKGSVGRRAAGEGTLGCKACFKGQVSEKGDLQQKAPRIIIWVSSKTKNC